MSNHGTNPLLSHPFFTIPDIDPNSPVTAQIQQIDQLNTLLLREIDENFARFHQIITSRILPEIKRFAIGSEPIRETSQVWRSFFEAAAASQIPTEGDLSAFGPSGHSKYEDETITLPRDDSYLSAAQEEGSFIFQPATSSTPLAGRTHERSWEDSMESPFEGVDRKLDNLKWDTNYAESSSAATPSLPSGYSLPKFNNTDTSYEVSTGTVNPLDLPRPATAQEGATPKAKAPQTKKWDGITDLRHTPLNAKFAKSKGKQPSQSSKPSMPSMNDLSLDDSDDDLKMTMSPPVTMKFALPPRVSAIMDIAKTPLKANSSRQSEQTQGEARMIVDDLLEAMSNDSPAMPEPKEFGRYSIAPTGYDSGRRLFDSNPSSSRAPLNNRQSMANTSFGSDIIEEPNNVGAGYQNDDSFEEDDSFDSAFGQGSHQVPADGEYGDITQSEAGDMSNVFGHPAKVPGQIGSFNLLKQDEMLTFRGGKLEDAAGAEEHRSPTYAHANRR